MLVPGSKAKVQDAPARLAKRPCVEACQPSLWGITTGST